MNHCHPIKHPFSTLSTLSFPKLAKRFGNAVLPPKLCFRETTAIGCALSDAITIAATHGNGATNGKRSFQQNSGFPKRYANFGNQSAAE